MTIFSAADMRRLEQAAMAEGMSEQRLMENAGSAAARAIRQTFPVAGRTVTILCGRGNNGGDGFVVARKLLEEGALVTVILMSGLPSTPQAREMYDRLLPSDVKVCSLETDPYLSSEAVNAANLLVDAVFGIGFHGRLPDHMRPLFRLVNRSAAPVMALDIPSGLQTDNAEFDEDTPRATRTLTFTALKPALFAASASAVRGEVTVLDIGIGKDLIARFQPDEVRISMDMVKACFAPREADSHKGTYGKLLCIGGQYGMAGAVSLCVEAALRCGSGLVTAAVPDVIYPIIAAGRPEAVYLPLPTTTEYQLAAAAKSTVGRAALTASAVVVGCGLGTGAGAHELTAHMLAHGHAPMVLDADGINCAALHIDRLKTATRPLVLTPHPGEMARLTGLSVDVIQRDRKGAARAFSEQYEVTLVLKGHETVIAAPHRTLLINSTGNAGMATGGSGDVLAGMIGAFLAQGMQPYEAAMCGVFLHGAAGDRAAARLSQHAMLPSDLTAELGGLFLELEN